MTAPSRAAVASPDGAAPLAQRLVAGVALRSSSRSRMATASPIRIPDDARTKSSARPRSSRWPATRRSISCVTSPRRVTTPPRGSF